MRGDGQYVYTDKPPTLLAAGLKEQAVTGSGKVTVIMWPLVIDTEFRSGTRTAAPEVTAGKPGAASLLPVNWDVKWTITRGISGNGLSDLVKAQKIPNKSAGDVLLPKSTPQILVRVRNEVPGDGTWITASLGGNVLIGSIGVYTEGFSKIGTKGSVNFKLQYIPFNLAGTGETNPWAVYNGKSVFDLGDQKEPVWIIRNGVNDLAQDGNTDFTRFHHIAGGDWGNANGNGAVRFEVAPRTPGGANGSTLKVKDGVFKGPSDSTEQAITFTTEGYDGYAEVYYAVVSAEAGEPDISGYTPLNNSSVLAGENHEGTITLDEGQAGEDNDVYVIIFKDGDVSAPYIINTGAGGIDVEPVWDEGPYMSLYVKYNGGADTNTGDKTSPLKTVGGALEKLAAAYQGASWPKKKGTDTPRSGAIIILDTVEVTAQIEISGTEYPPIILDDEAKGKLQAKSGIGSGNNLLKLTDGADVTLTGGLILAGIGTQTSNIRGVYVSNNCTFIMDGGEISGNSVSDYWGANGGGVYVTGGMFTMNGGEISGNFATTSSVSTFRSYGGGVYVTGGTFTMNGGEISGNSASAVAGTAPSTVYSAYAYGGGVYAKNTLFTMNGGEISGNSISAVSSAVSSSDVKSIGGGVYVSGGMFTMTSGEISGNSASAVSSGGSISLGGGGVGGGASPTPPIRSQRPAAQFSVLTKTTRTTHTTMW
jgi:hypothetical protein